MIYRPVHTVELTETLQTEQSSMMHTDRKPLQSHLRPFSVLVFHLLLINFCGGQSQLIGSSLPIIARLGGDITLPCHLEPAEDATGLTLEWTRPDLNPRFVHVWRSGQELEGKKHKFFEGRTSLFVDELNVGNISLKLSKVRLSDHGTYRCFIPTPDQQTFVQLIVVSDAASSPVITLEEIDRSTSGVILDCKSKGWHPEPEVLWLDGEGNLLPAGPTETVRGPDDLYTVSSRVTVEKRHSNNFTCRVQQKNINQTRETHIYISDKFFDFQSRSSATTVGLAVILAVCILLILLLVFFVWRQNRIKTKGDQRGENDKGENKKNNKTKDQVVTEEEREKEQLMTDRSVKMKKEKGKKKSKDQDASKCEVMLDSQRVDGSSTSQSSTTGPFVIRVDQVGKYINFTNTSKEDQQLGGWKLQIRVNNTKPITHTFEDPFKLGPVKHVSFWAQGCGSHHPPTDLRLDDLKPLSSADKLQVVLINNTEDTKLTLPITHI